MHKTQKQLMNGMKKHILGLTQTPMEQALAWRQMDDSTKKRAYPWILLRKHKNILSLPRKRLYVYRGGNLVELVEQLKKEGVNGSRNN